MFWKLSHIPPAFTVVPNSLDKDNNKEDSTDVVDDAQRQNHETDHELHFPAGCFLVQPQCGDQFHIVTPATRDQQLSDRRTYILTEGDVIHCQIHSQAEVGKRG